MRLKTGHLAGATETALGTGDRIISFNNLQLDHLSKQQVIGSGKPARHTLQRVTMLKREEILATIFTTAILWVDC
jgi:hypothetical protein